ncbi:unnamed protein product, partial [Vitis vinifera]|uniref:Uncharacterized protein n=1 Tax=Vitis vinifera TaxID=29760 RepID=D7SMI7_VITVI
MVELQRRIQMVMVITDECVFYYITKWRPNETLEKSRKTLPLLHLFQSLKALKITADASYRLQE